MNFDAMSTAFCRLETAVTTELFLFGFFWGGGLRANFKESDVFGDRIGQAMATTSVGELGKKNHKACTAS